MSSHTYWRINITSVGGGSGWNPSCREISMFDVPSGGTDKCTGGTAFASAYYAFGVPALAFDDNTGTSWISNVNVPTPSYIGYQFASPVEVARVQWWGQFDGR